MNRRKFIPLLAALLVPIGYGMGGESEEGESNETAQNGENETIEIGAMHLTPESVDREDAYSSGCPEESDKIVREDRLDICLFDENYFEAD